MADPKTPVLEPAAQAFAAATAGPPFTYELPVEVSRKGLEELQSGDDLKPAADVTDVIVNTGATGSVKVRILTSPNSLGPWPAVLHARAGWVLGSPSTHERLARDLAVGANVAVVLPRYDRSPEAKYPTAVEQCWAVAKWFWDQYTTDPVQRAEITAAALNATREDLEGLPPALIINGEADVLRDEGEAYGDKLRAAGVPVTAVR